MQVVLKIESTQTQILAHQDEEAERLGLETVELQKKVLGPEHRGTLASMSGLANRYSSQGRYKEGEKLGLETL